jgi:hypothetical protein
VRFPLLAHLRANCRVSNPHRSIQAARHNARSVGAHRHRQNSEAVIAKQLGRCSTHDQTRTIPSSPPDTMRDLSALDATDDTVLS